MVELRPIGDCRRLRARPQARRHPVQCLPRNGDCRAREGGEEQTFVGYCLLNRPGLTRRPTTPVAEEDCVTRSPTPGRPGLLPPDTSHS